MLIITDSMLCSHTVGFSQRNVNKTTTQFLKIYFEDEKKILPEKKRGSLCLKAKLLSLKKSFELH